MFRLRPEKNKATPRGVEFFNRILFRLTFFHLLLFCLDPVTAKKNKCPIDYARFKISCCFI